MRPNLRKRFLQVLTNRVAANVSFLQALSIFGAGMLMTRSNTVFHCGRKFLQGRLRCLRLLQGWKGVVAFMSKAPFVLCSKPILMTELVQTADLPSHLQCLGCQ